MKGGYVEITCKETNMMLWHQKTNAKAPVYNLNANCDGEAKMQSLDVNCAGEKWMIWIGAKHEGDNETHENNPC